MKQQGDTHDTNNPRLPSRMLTSPSKITRIQPERTVLQVPASNTNTVNTFWAKLCVGGLTTEFEFSFLAVLGTMSTCMRTLVSGGARDTYFVSSCLYARVWGFFLCFQTVNNSGDEGKGKVEVRTT